ncbi:hypothetical protein WKH56_20970 [Priestia sp. SB1]|uniref:hypothetical protein n=1 Tax=Priestia sp. SB1 TaxID=3132359 RepID=UPI00316FA8EE
MGKKITLTELKEKFAERGYVLIDPTEVNSKARYQYVCNKHKENGIQEISHAQFSRGRGCKFCGIEKSNKNGRKRNIVDVEKEFKEHGLHVVEGQEYLNGKQKIKFLCEKHIDFGIQEMSYEHFKSKEIKGCKQCGLDFKGNQQKKDFDEIKSFVENLGYTLISDSSEYKNLKSEIRMICPKHGEFSMTWSNFYNRKRCQSCGKDLVVGSNHHSWNGGITPLRKSLREKLSDWKLRSMENCSFLCVITGDKFDDVHHLQSFNLIMDETFKNLNLVEKDNLSDLTNDELLLVEKECLRLHDSYPLGICLRKDVHKLFHRLYGSKNNTAEQFYDFQEKIKNKLIKINY